MNLNVLYKITEALNRQKTYYLKTVSIAKNSFVLVIKSNEIEVESINFVNDEGVFEFKNVKTKKNRIKGKKYIITKKNSALKKRLKVEIEDFNGNKYFLTLLFYSAKYNIDEIPSNFNITYNRSKDYPILLTSNSHVVGNYYIFDELGNQIYAFEMLISFSLFIDALKKGNYIISENNFSNKIFTLTIK